MTDIKTKALALVNEVAKHYRANIGEADFDEVERAFYRAIEQHEAFKREVSDAIQSCMLGPVAEERLSPFIIIKPVDPLVEAVREASPQSRDEIINQVAENITKAIEARGGRIVWEGE